MTFITAAASSGVQVDEISFFVIVVAAALAALAVAFFGSRVAIPVVVIELLLGIVIGPQILDFAQPDNFVGFFASLGLGMLFFFAGYEIDFQRIRGKALNLAIAGWILSLIIAYGLGGILAWAGVVLSLLYTGSAMATTAIGTLVPILSDAGEMRTRFGTYLLGAGAIGEFGPILLLTLVLTTTTAKNLVILIVFVVLAVLAAIAALQLAPRSWGAVERTLESSSQLAVRLTVVIILVLIAFASGLGLELLLGGFAAGMIVRLVVQGREVEVLESKLVGLGYGFLIPFFFIYSGMNFDLDSLIGSTEGLLKLPLFLVMFLLARGIPALLLYRGVLELRDRFALAFYSATQLPLVVAITTIAVEAGDMEVSTSAALVGAAILSTLFFPLIAMRLRSGRVEGDVDPDVELEREAEGFTDEPLPA
ncbi:MAG: cation:proton antiporter [Solirubrobacteraceae bacterium]|nr:cation:proton antiporter [Solirubrobacteraceae bacterium]MDP4920983.1 cation:proton antiporter [Solirubrobacteraceae bacterium]